MSNNADLRKEVQVLRDLSANLRMKLLFKEQEPPPTKVSEVVVHTPKYYCEHRGMSTKSENQQQKLEEKLRTFKKVIRNLRTTMADVVDMPAWQRPTTHGEVDLVGCLYCAAKPIRWQDLTKRFPHEEGCPWLLMEKRALTEGERSLGE